MFGVTNLKSAWRYKIIQQLTSLGYLIILVNSSFLFLNFLGGDWDQDINISSQIRKHFPNAS